jgi:hypothetical protein
MIEMFGFVVGVHLTIMLLASLYRILDLWYCFRDHWLVTISRILLISGLIFLVYFFTREEFRIGFQVGQIFFMVFHITMFWITRLIIVCLRYF